MVDGLHRIQERLDAVEQGRFARRRQSRQPHKRRAFPHHSQQNPASNEPRDSFAQDEGLENHSVDLRV